MQRYKLIVLGSQSPNEKTPVMVDFTPQLQKTGDTLQGSTPEWSFINTSDPRDVASLTIEFVSKTLYAVIGEVSGGKPGVMYIITCKVTSYLGNDYERSAYLPVERFVS